MQGINLELTPEQRFELIAMKQRLDNTQFSDQKQQLTDIIVDLLRINMVQKNNLSSAYKHIINLEMGGKIQ